MSQHQHRKLERGRESAKAGKQPFQQPVNKDKSEQGKGASVQVKFMLKQHIHNKQHRKSEHQDPEQQPGSNTPGSFLEEDSPLRKKCETTSDATVKLRPKRSLTRRSPLQRKVSAPPAARAPESMALSASSAPVLKGSSSPDKQMNHQEPQTSSRSSPHQIAAGFSQDDCLLHRGPILCHAYAAPVMPPQILPFPFVTVPYQWTITAHKPLSKSRSHPLAHTYMVTHPMYQQHTFPEKEPDQPMSPGELEKDRESPLDNCCSNRLECRNQSDHKKLTRVYSVPVFSFSSYSDSVLGVRNVRSKASYTGLVYDSQVLRTECGCGNFSFHPDHADRITSIWSRLEKCGLTEKCEWVKGRHATAEELMSVHSEQHVCFYTGQSGTKSSRVRQPEMSHDQDWSNSCGTEAQLKAAGSVVELTLCVARGELKNGFAVVTPPGHHASHSQTYGASVFNSVAIAAKQLQEKLNVKKILIVDWDIHHGSGTEDIFYTDPHVLFISIHRYDNRLFFPGTGDPSRVGSEKGEGYNVNVAWSGGLSQPIGDAEYLAAFKMVVMPIAHEFAPDVVLVSAGFDAAMGNSPEIGGYEVSAACFGFLTRKLMALAEGRVVLVLEGGYDLSSLCDAAQACVSALLGHESEPLSEEEQLRSPCTNAVMSLESVLHVQSRYWRSVRSALDTVDTSSVKAERRHSVGSEAAFALGGLTMTVPDRRRFQIPNEPEEHDETDFMQTRKLSFSRH